jgi:Leucine-rich repeat (LRR) protein
MALVGNQLEGSLPTQLGLLTALTTLAASFNDQLTGPLPSELGLLTNLTVMLGLMSCHFTGTIPTQLGQLKSIEELKVRGNQLTGQVPSELGQLTSLGFLSVANNSLSGPIPQELSGLQHTLHTVELNGNPMLSGVIPEAICELNGTCAVSWLGPCIGPFGLSFDCSSNFSGCGLCAH